MANDIKKIRQIIARELEWDEHDIDHPGWFISNHLDPVEVLFGIFKVLDDDQVIEFLESDETHRVDVWRNDAGSKNFEITEISAERIMLVHLLEDGGIVLQTIESVDVF